MPFQKHIAYLVSCLTLVILFICIVPSYVAAHIGGYKPLVTVNNKFTIENIVVHYAKAQSFILSTSKASQSYIINQPITFEGIASTYHWSFGDGSSIQEGVKVEHSYTKPGTYFVLVKKNTKTDTKLVDVVEIDVLPSQNYSLPQINLQANQKPITKNFFNYINLETDTNIVLDASKSKGTIQKYLWEFSDGQTAEGKKITYTYKGDSNSVTVILRVVDSNNIINEEYTYLIFTNRSNNITEFSGPNIISSNQPTAFNLTGSAQLIQAFYLKPIAWLPISSLILVVIIYLLSLKKNNSINSSAFNSTKVTLISQRLRPYIRQIIYTLAIIWATYLYYYASVSIPTTTPALSALMRYFGLTALVFLFMVLTPGLLRVYFPGFVLNSLFIYMRRALGLSMVFFVCVHALIGWVYNLSGSITAIFFLSQRYQLAIASSTTAFIIFLLMALTSTDKMMNFLNFRRWKALHRCIYVAAILVLFHAFLIGSNFTNPSSTIPLFINFFALTFILLELIATGKEWIRLQSATTNMLKFFRYSLLCVAGISAFLLSNYVLYKGAYDPHAQHRNSSNQQYEAKLQSYPLPVVPGADTNLAFRIYDKKTGAVVDKFDIFQEKMMHLIILSSDLNEYQHIHPSYIGNGTFTVKTKFPREGTYNLYAEYSPTGQVEAVSILTIYTSQAHHEMAQLQIDPRTKIFLNKYKVNLKLDAPITINESVDFTYTIQDVKTGKPIRTLEPYLGSFGHLAIVSEDGETFTHVHPIDIPVITTEKGGPSVRFNTLFQKPGKYKLFAQFKHQNAIFVTDFVINVQ